MYSFYFLIFYTGYLQHNVHCLKGILFKLAATELKTFIFAIENQSRKKAEHSSTIFINNRRYKYWESICFNFG